MAEWLPIYDRQPDRARQIARTINSLRRFRVVGWFREEDIIDEGLRVPVIKREPGRLNLDHNPMAGQEDVIGRR